MSEEDDNRDWEAEAKPDGWVDEKDFKGDNRPAVFYDAKTFVLNGEKINSNLKAKLGRQDESIAELREEVQRQARANAEFGEYHQQTVERQKRENADRIVELEREIAQAVTDGDGTVYTEKEREREQLREQARESEVAPAQTEHNRRAEAWTKDNSWYDNESAGYDAELRKYADNIAPRIDAEGYTGPAFFKELTRRTKAEYPNKFNNPRQTDPSSVEMGGDREGSEDPKPKTYEALPPDAKAACDRFIKDGFTTKEKYCANYDWED